MRLGTSTNLLFIRPDGTRVPLTETLEKVSEAGFKVFDLNFYDWSLPGSPFLTDDWKVWIEEVAQKAQALGVTFGQCHAYVYNFLNPNMTDEERARHEELQHRSFECCHILKAHTCILHPETSYRGVNIVKHSYEDNKAFFERKLAILKKYNLKLAIENMCDYGIAPKRKFCAYPEELVDFVDTLNDSSVGICWDFEHADIMGQNQRDALLHMGNRLIATHVSDTYSKTDNTLMHVLPMTGTVNWQEVMETLKEIAYEGDFCYEVHNYMNRLPDPVVTTGLKLAYEIGEHLMGLSK